jgi:hypothetical protein
VLQPTDVRVQRPSRRNVHFKWGFPVEKTAPGAVTPIPKPPQPSALLKKLLIRVDSDIKPTQPAQITPKVTDRTFATKPDVPRETKAEHLPPKHLPPLESPAQMRARVEAEEAEIRRLEVDLAAAQQRRKRREARLALVETLARKRFDRIRASIEVVTARFAKIEDKLAEANRQAAVVAALHKKLARAAEKGQTRHIVDRIEEARLAELQLRHIHTDLIDLQNAIGVDLGHDRRLARLEREHAEAEIARLQERHRQEITRLEVDMRRQRNNLLAIQTAVQLLLDGE